MTLAVVTGGGHRVGAVISAALAREGFDIAIHSHRKTDPDPALLALLGAEGRRWATFEADLAEEAPTLRLLDDITAHFGRAPSCLINSASMFDGDGWGGAGMAAFTDYFRVNAAAPAILTQRLAALLGDGRGVVVNILDQAIRNPTIDHAAYTASKLALAGITQVTARAYAPTLRVSAVAPGLNLPTDDYSLGQLDRLAALMPLKALPNPSQIADAVIYLVKAEATTGQVIYVDGGASLTSFERDFIHVAADPA
jgi:NAD(P)-dependent dehydrogenase (short-subunit alcohol dehydrogenase family)